MKVLWVVPRQALITSAAGVTSDLASIRYRVLVPIAGLRANGHDAAVIGLDRTSADEVRRQIASADHIVFIKNYTDPVCSETILAEQQALGKTTWFDLTDDRFDGPASEHLQRMVTLADRVVTVSDTLRQTILRHTGKESAIVGDPYEGPRGIPRWAPAATRLKTLWFGYGWNVQALMKSLPSLAQAALTFPLELKIVTGGVEGLDRYCGKFNQKSQPAMAISHTKWSREETWRSLAETDLVIIPALLDEPWTLAKSPNRIIEALWAGRFVVAHPIPSYVQFEDWAWLGAELADGITWAMHNQAAIEARITSAQDYIATAFSPQRIAQEWERLLQAG